MQEQVTFETILVAGFLVLCVAIVVTVGYLFSKIDDYKPKKGGKE